MQAIRVREFGPPEVLRLEQTTLPPLTAGQVLVQVAAVGVNPVDTYIRAGIYGKLPELPYTPGFDAAGVVAAVGPEVTRFRPGDRVYTAWTLSGAYAEQSLCSEEQLHPLPESVSFAQGAAVNVPYATAYRALFQKARALPGETLLVHGASGGVGLAALQLARAAGLTVFGTAGSEAGRQLVAAQGAHQVFDHGASDCLEQVLQASGGRGVDVVLEMLANVNLGRDLNVLAQQGRVVVIGSRGPVEIEPRAAMSRDAAILGMTLFNTSAEDRRLIHAALGAGLANGTLRPVIGAEFKLAEAAAAQRAVMAPGHLGKVVLLP